MVKLCPPSVASPKNPKMAKAKTPKKGEAVDTPVKTEMKTTPKQTKKITRAALLAPKVKKEAKSTTETPNETEAAPLEIPKTKRGAMIKKVKSTPKAAAAPEIPKIGKVTLKMVEKSSKAAAALETDKSSKLKKKTLLKKAKSIPNEGASQTLKNRTASAKRTMKVKTPKQKPAEDVEMASEGEEEAVPAASPVKAQQLYEEGDSILPEKCIQSVHCTKSVNCPSAISAAPKQNGKFCLYVKGLNYKTDQEAVIQHFSQFGTVARCFLPRNPEKTHLNKGFGFIDFKSQPSLDRALAKTHALDGRTLQLNINNTERPTIKRKREESDEPTGGEKKQHVSSFEHELFISKLSFCTSHDTIRDHFSQFGEVIYIGLPKKDKTQNKGFAFVAFKDASSLQKALEDTNHVIDAVEINLKQKKQKESVGREEAVSKSSYPNELFVGGLDPTTLKETLEQHFSRYGKVSTVTLPWNKLLNRNKGFAFVSFESAASLKQALQKDHEIDGMRLDIRPAENKAENNCTASTKAGSKTVLAMEEMEEVESEEAESEEEESESQDEKAEVEEETESEDSEQEEGESEDEEAEEEDEESENDEDEEEEDDEAESEEEAVIGFPIN